jgi:cation diffusion facilitator family transporter
MRATLVGIGANVALFGIKAAATSLSDSLTIFSETLNSLSDVVASIAILIFVRWAWKNPDEDHPFGHRRAEPVAGLLVAIFIGILGFEVCRSALVRLVETGGPSRIGAWPIGALIVTAISKSVMAIYFYRRAKQLHSPAFRATAVDCRNDVIISLQGLLAVVLAQYSLPVLDTIAALLIGGYILYSAHLVGMENMNYLMGKAPDSDMLRDIHRVADDVAGVVEVDDIKGHYVGTFIHVELTARVLGHVSTHESHDIAEGVRHAVEQLGMVDRAFVHIEPALPTASTAGTP